MRCLGPLTLKTTPMGFRPVVPCNQCLNCRLDRRDKLVTRCLLESRSAGIGQFWTLTFSDSGLSALEEKGARKLYNNWLNALRMKERRNLGRSMIRCFGVLEHGEMFERPHLHVLIWNHYNSILPESPYKEGLPRPRFSIAQWPHGHVDCCDLNTKSCRYVCKYVTKFNQTAPSLQPTNTEPICFRPQRPTLGLDGLRLHVQSLSRSPTRKWEQPSTIELDGRQWALDQTMRRHYMLLLKKHQIRSVNDTLTKRIQRQTEQRIETEETPWHTELYRLNQQATKERIYSLAETQRKQRLAAVYSRSLQLAALR
ncbi:replication initiator protein [Microviridae sp.]|nr:replication initiator protein [Microviridae sp.]